jgi:hypothetical protein
VQIGLHERVPEDETLMPNRMLTMIEKYAQTLPPRKRKNFRRLAWMMFGGMNECPVRGMRPAKRKR